MPGDDGAATEPRWIQVGEGVRGRGVFAARDIPAGQTVELCPTLEVEDTAASGTLRDYVFSSNEADDMAVLPLGFGTLYNHSSDANCEYVEHAPGWIAFVARRDVPAGEELTIDYGDGWWDGRDEVPR